MTNRKYFSLEEAQKLIPEVRRSVFKIIKIDKAINLLSEIEVLCEDDAEACYRDIKFNRKFHQLSYKLFSEMEKLSEKGAILTELDKGIVKFCSRYNKTPIFLCWKIGDKHIKYWHLVGEDFSDKRPLSTLFNPSDFVKRFK
ncbi:MAG: DUF2203 family protein [Candidatus Woesearchaeota archaeon]